MPRERASRSESAFKARRPAKMMVPMSGFSRSAKWSRASVSLELAFRRLRSPAIGSVDDANVAASGVVLHSLSPNSGGGDAGAGEATGVLVAALGYCSCSCSWRVVTCRSKSSKRSLRFAPSLSLATVMACN